MTKLLSRFNVLTLLLGVIIATAWDKLALAVDPTSLPSSADVQGAFDAVGYKYVLIALAVFFGFFALGWFVGMFRARKGRVS